MSGIATLSLKGNAMSPQLTLSQLQARLAQPSTPVLVDAFPERYFAADHLPGAVNVPHTVADDIVRARLPDRDALIVTYCANPACQNSHVLAHRLQVLGYRNVAVFPGGKTEWKEAGLPLESAMAAEV
jgi:rhodanese-related sulfurtransferase